MINKFGEFLYQLRKEQGMTQAELAEMLGITNKAVSKWETGESFPETAHLVPLSSIFSVTVDELLKGQRSDSVTTASEQAQDIPVPTQQPLAKFEALGTALSIATILIGVFCFIILNSIDITYRIGVPVMLFCVATGVFFLILINMRRTLKSVEIEATDYVKGFRCILMISGGVFLVICAAASMVGLLKFGYKYAFPTFFSLLIIGIFLLVFGGISWDAFGKKYNLPDQSPTSSPKKKKMEEAICGVIMLTATGAFFLLGFIGNKWHPGWVVFPVGGILCGIVSTIFKGVDNSHS